MGISEQRRGVVGIVGGEMEWSVMYGELLSIIKSVLMRRGL